MEPIIKIRDLWFSYEGLPVLENISVDIARQAITSLSGPSGQGKSSFLTVLNRLWESVQGAWVRGQVRIDLGKGFEDIYTRDMSLSRLRRKVGMVFQVPNPLPMSIFKNIAFPLKLAGEKDETEISQKVQTALEQAFLWEEVKDRLSEDAGKLSGGQQQRLCIARSLVLEPRILLLDEPTSSLDETSVRVIEDLLLELKSRCTIVLVSHYMDQVKRIADHRLVLSEKKINQV